MRKAAAGVFLLLLLASGFGSARANDDAKAWAALASGGHVIVVRHGNAPDNAKAADTMPPDIEGCVTQRNLDALGRKQAVALGEAIRAHKIVVDKVLTSAWCRTRETALLMNLGPVAEETPMWRRIGMRTANVEEAAAEIRGLVSQWRGPGTLVIVNHGSTMRSVFDIGHPPQPAEMIVLKPLPDGTVQVVGSIDPPKP